MRRRKFLSVLGGAAAAWPLGARAQQAVPIVGFLGTETAELWASRVQAFRKGLGEGGYVEGRNVVIEYRWAEGHHDRLPALAADLIQRRVAVIATNGPATSAVKVATASIPIVFQGGFDPVAEGYVASLNRPGGNVTGGTASSGELTPKRLELLHELVPEAMDIGLLVNPNNRTYGNLLSSAREAGRRLGVRVHVLQATTEAELQVAFTALEQLRAGGLVIGPDSFFSARSGKLGALALRHGTPAISEFREFAAAGGLLSYGSSITERSFLVGRYVGRILKGEKPAELPVQQDSKTELIVNLKAAKTVGVIVPMLLLGRADEVIE